MKQPIGQFSGKNWILTETWECKLSPVYRLPALNITVLPGFTSDGASIPRILWPLVGPRFAPETFAAAFAHDALYGAHLTRRAYADYQFYFLLRELDVRRIKAESYWAAVRTCGWFAWRKSKEEIESARKFINLS